jgi:hypothetical protein
VVAEHVDGRIRWFRASDGRLLLTFYPHRDQERWVAWTPEGYYDASPRGEELIAWLQNHGKDREATLAPASQFHEQYYRPSVVAHALDAPPSGESPELP